MLNQQLLDQHHVPWRDWGKPRTRTKSATEFDEEQLLGEVRSLIKEHGNLVALRFGVRATMLCQPKRNGPVLRAHETRIIFPCGTELIRPPEKRVSVSGSVRTGESALATLEREIREEFEIVDDAPLYDFAPLIWCEDKETTRPSVMYPGSPHPNDPKFLSRRFDTLAVLGLHPAHWKKVHREKTKYGLIIEHEWHTYQKADTLKDVFALSSSVPQARKRPVSSKNGRPVAAISFSYFFSPA